MVFRCNSDILTLIPSQSATECVSIEEILSVSVFFYAGQVVLQV
jgi:hypothetical protein